MDRTIQKSFERAFKRTVLIASLILLKSRFLRFLTFLNAETDQLGSNIEILGINEKRKKISYHQKNMAIDFVVKNNLICLTEILQAGIKAGFNGVGVYWGKNNIISFHFDLAKRNAIWLANYKHKNDKNWTYYYLNYPKNIFKTLGDKNDRPKKQINEGI